MKIIKTFTVLALIFLAFIIGQKSKQSKIDNLTSQIEKSQNDIVNSNTIPTQFILDCWSNNKPSSTVAPMINTNLMNKNVNYCLVVPNDNWDF